MKLAECKLGTLVCIAPDAMRSEDGTSNVIGHVVGLKSVTTGAVVSQRYESEARSLEIRGAGRWEGEAGIYPMVQFADRGYPVVFDFRNLDLFTEY